MKIEELKKVVEKVNFCNGETIEDYFEHEQNIRVFQDIFNPSLVSKLLRVVEAATRLANVEFMGDEKNYQDEDIVMVSVGLVRETRAALRDLEQS